MMKHADLILKTEKKLYLVPRNRNTIILDTQDCNVAQRDGKLQLNEKVKLCKPLKNAKKNKATILTMLFIYT